MGQKQTVPCRDCPHCGNRHQSFDCEAYDYFTDPDDPTQQIAVLPGDADPTETNAGDTVRTGHVPAGRSTPVTDDLPPEPAGCRRRSGPGPHRQRSHPRRRTAI